jgi:hypothetical protein
VFDHHHRPAASLAVLGNTQLHSEAKGRKIAKALALLAGNRYPVGWNKAEGRFRQGRLGNRRAMLSTLGKILDYALQARAIASKFLCSENQSLINITSFMIHIQVPDFRS